MIGIFGAGQLGRMLGQAALNLDLPVRYASATADTCVGRLGPVEVFPWRDHDRLRGFFSACDVATFEFENIELDAFKAIEHSETRLAPSAHAIEVFQDRLREKSLARKLGLATAPFMALSNQSDQDMADCGVSFPAILKTRRWGYDGKSQVAVENQANLPAAWQKLDHAPALLESRISFQWEGSILVVRAASGDIKTYPPSWNVHHKGILVHSQPLTHDMQREIGSQAADAACALAESLDYVGVLAIEFFWDNGRFIFNEGAPRVHNSGHWTIEGSATSQFENHLRAVAGLPLGDTTSVAETAMLNILGKRPDPRELLRVPGVHLHDYGKAERPGRKIGHVTVVAADANARNERFQRVQAILAKTNELSA